MEHIQTGAQIGLQTEYYTGGEKAIKIIWDRIKKTDMNSMLNIRSMLNNRGW